MIRTDIINRIRSVIDTLQYFDSFDFTIKTEKPYVNSIQLRVTYNFDERYKIIINIPNHQDHSQYTGEMCPGPILLEEKFSFPHPDSIYTYVKNWAESIWSELSANPVVKEIDSNEKK